MKRAWSLPSSCQSYVMETISDNFQLFGVTCRRALRFVRKISCKQVVRDFAIYSVYHGRMASVLGSNVPTGCERFAISVDCSVVIA